MALGGEHAGLGTSEGLSLGTKGLHGHGNECVGDALAGGQQHVHLTLRRDGVDLRCKIKQVIGGISHGGAHNNDVVALLLRRHNALRHRANALCAFEGGSPVFLYD